MKRCSRCGGAKPTVEFCRDASKADGLMRYCRSCNSSHTREWKARNQERKRELNRRWAERNPEHDRDAKDRHRAKIRGAGFIESVYRMVLLDMYDGACGICGGELDPTDFEIDHIIPLSRGGFHNYENVQPAHSRCNANKHVKVEV